MSDPPSEVFYMYRNVKDREWEDFAVLLDIYKKGNLSIGQVIGERYLKLMEFQLDPDVDFRELERVFVGHGKRKIKRFLRHLSYTQLTENAKKRLGKAIEKILLMEEEKWVDFFNKAGPVSHRGHSLELLPSIGKKKVMTIIEEREDAPFESYNDIRERVGIDPISALRDKILEEIKGMSQHVILLIWAKKYSSSLSP
ncbi:MAG TPA: DUF655 domain-containing protein [Thermoprotei archaeon]|nr:DUF655 domain-containing protein [Thermoprotei archaeon]